MYSFYAFTSQVQMTTQRICRRLRRSSESFVARRCRKSQLRRRGRSTVPTVILVRPPGSGAELLDALEQLPAMTLPAAVAATRQCRDVDPYEPHEWATVIMTPEQVSAAAQGRVDPSEALEPKPSDPVHCQVVLAPLEYQPAWVQAVCACLGVDLSDHERALQVLDRHRP